MYSFLRTWCQIRGCRSLRTKIWMLVLAVISFTMLLGSYVGLFTQTPERNEFPYFLYPLEGDITEYISHLMSGNSPEVPPINEYHYPYIIPNRDKCRTGNASEPNIHVLVIVKSAVKNFDQRRAIRRTWGREQRFNAIVIRRVFNLGLLLDNPLIQQKVKEEHHQNGDIVQSGFVDVYFNNTIKTMMGFNWAVENCANAEFVLCADDDMYVSMKNVLRFIRYPHEYSNIFNYGQLPEVFDDVTPMMESDNRTIDYIAGYTKYTDSPVRYNRSKWHILPSEYAFVLYPPFIPGGAFIMPFSTLRKMNFASKYTKHFRFDDVYLGIVASKAGITCLHSEYFYFVKKSYSSHDYRMVIASHGYHDPKELIQVWDEQHKLSYA